MGKKSKKSEVVATQDDSTPEEKAAQALKFATASGRFGAVGRRSATWKTSKK